MKKHLLIIPAIIIMLFNSTVKAMPYCPPMDFCPMMDPLDQVGSIFTNITDLGTQVQSFGNQVISDANNLFASTKSMFSGNINNIVLFAGKSGGGGNNEGGGETAGERGLENCVYLGKEYKNTSSEDVFDLIQLLLLRYPSNSIVDMQSYDTRRENFYVDNLLEIYTTIRELETEMANDIGPKLDETIACITGDANTCGIGSPDASNDAAFVVGKAFEAVDQLYELLLKVTALKAQYIAVKSLRDIRPLNYVKTSDKQAFLNKNNEFELATVISHQEEISFAQVSQDDTSTEEALQEELAAEKEKAAAQADDTEEIEIPDGVIGFVVAKDSPSEHAYVSVEDQMEELNKIAPLEEKVSGAREVHNLINGLSAYKHAAESVRDTRLRHQAAIEALRLSEQCTSNYICSYFNNPTAQECKNICFGEDGESGILGWAIQYHEAAKAAETSSTDTEDVQSPDIDYETASENSDVYDSDNKVANEILSKEEANVNTTSNSEKQVEESRRAEMLAWQVGAEASKMLAAEPSKWGNNAKSTDRLVWNDEKNFYTQYLTKKYENIKEYLKTFTIADVLNVMASHFEGNPIGLSDTPYQKKRANLMSQLEADLEELITSSATDSGLQELMAKREGIAQKLENLNAELKDVLNELSVARDKAQEDAGQSMLDNVNYVEPFPTDIDAPTPQSSPIVGVSSTATLYSQFTSQSQSNKAELGVENLNQKADNLRADITQLDEDLNNIDDDIREYKLNMQDADSATMTEINNKKQALFDKVADTLSDAEISAKEQSKNRLLAIIATALEENPNPMLTPELVYVSLEKVANTALSDSYAQMNAIIDKALQRILNMGDDLYNPKNHSRIVDIHQQMLTEIGGLVINISGGILPAVNNIAMFAKVAGSDSAPESEDYFVGSPAKSRDMKAPMAMFEQHLPNVREVVHFDSTDFQNVKPITKRRNKKNTPIKAKDFLNYGGEIPKVWKYLLRDYAFVETKISLKDILSIGCELETFFRQGTLPCKVGYDTAVDINDQGDYVTIGNDKNLYKCAGITTKKSKLYHGALDVNVRTGEKTATSNCKYSELGVLLTVDDGKLMFKDEVYDAFYTLWAEENNKKDSKNHKKDLASVELAPLSKNQIGNYLFYKENEHTMKEQKEETEESYKGKITELFDIMANYGYELAEGKKPEDVDLSDEEIYEGIRSSLDDIKSELIVAAENLQANINISSDNKVVKERVDTLKNVIARLKQDKNEMVNIGDDVGSKEDLDARIKSAKANKDTADTHENAWESVSGSEVVEAPYCSNY